MHTNFPNMFPARATVVIFIENHAFVIIFDVSNAFPNRKIAKMLGVSFEELGPQKTREPWWVQFSLST